MVKKLWAHAADLRARTRLTIDGIAGIADLVEAMHDHIASVPGILAKSKGDRTTSITGLVYRSIRGVVGLVGHGFDRLLARLDSLLAERSTWPAREAKARLDVRRVAAVGGLWRQPPRSAQPARSRRANQAVAGRHRVERQDQA